MHPFPTLVSDSDFILNIYFILIWGRETHPHTYTQRGGGGGGENEHEIMYLLKLGHETIALLGIYPKEIIRNRSLMFLQDVHCVIAYN